MKFSLHSFFASATLFLTTALAAEEYSFFVTTYSTKTCSHAANLTGAVVVPKPPSADECGSTEPICVPFEDSQAVLTTFLNADTVEDREDWPRIMFRKYDNEDCSGAWVGGWEFTGDLCLDLRPGDHVKSVAVTSFMCR